MEKIKSIIASDISEGMSFDQLVFIDPYTIFLQAREVVEKKHLNKLKELGIQTLETHGDIINLDKFESGGGLNSNKKNALLLEYEIQLEEFQKASLKTVEVLDYISAKIEKNFRDYLYKRAPEVNDMKKLIILFMNLIIKNPLVIILLQYRKVSYNRIINHTINYSAYGVIIARALGYDNDKIQNLIFTMFVMDIGMLTIPKEIQEKSGTLEPKDIAVIKKHPIFSYKLISNAANENIMNVSGMVIQHHERYDGKGYPRGLAKDDINELVRVISICDAYCAMIEGRPYRKAKLPREAIKELMVNANKQFDGNILKVFVKELSLYPIGSLLKLSDESLGIVVFANENKPDLPILKLMRDKNGKHVTDIKFVNLAYESKISIKEVVDHTVHKINPLKYI